MVFYFIASRFMYFCYTEKVTLQDIFSCFFFISTGEAHTRVDNTDIKCATWLPHPGAVKRNTYYEEKNPRHTLLQ